MSDKPIPQGRRTRRHARSARRTTAVILAAVVALGLVVSGGFATADWALAAARSSQQKQPERAAHVGASAAAPRPASVPSAAAAPIPTAVVPVPADPLRVVTIGDSIMKGFGLSPDQAWPALLGQENGWSVTNLGCDGAGFSQVGSASDCGTPFSGLIPAAVSLQPQVIFISGSSNDLGISDDTLLSQTLAALQSLRASLPKATIIGISTIWNDQTEVPGQIDDINQQVKQAVQGVGGTFIDVGQPLTGHPEWMQDDDVHPTAAGQQQLAVAIGAAITSAQPHTTVSTPLPVIESRIATMHYEHTLPAPR